MQKYLIIAGLLLATTMPTLAQPCSGKKIDDGDASYSSRKVHAKHKKSNPKASGVSKSVAAKTTTPATSKSKFGDAKDSTSAERSSKTGG